MALPPETAALLRKYALQNAVHHLGKAEVKSLLGKVLGAEAALRPHAKDLAAVAAPIVEAVNALGLEAQKAELAKVDPSLLEKKVKEQREGLRPLPDDDKVPKIVMRFAPNPNGPATLGHSRGMVVHGEFQRMYKAQNKPFHMILRFDDTDPATKKPVLEAYTTLRQDFEWLGGRPDEVVQASDRIPLYYGIAQQLIDAGKAYVCECTGEAFKVLKDKAEACPHRERPPLENGVVWKKMLEGGFAPGQAVLRIPTDIKHPDPALRDWVAFRIVLESHPRVGTKYKVWPLLDFQSAVDDHLLGVTHIVRGKDLIDSEHKQKFLYAHLGWKYPVALHWGRVQVHEFGKVSKSLIGEGIAAGKFTGWDDVRLPTLMALRRRGIRPEAIRQFWIGLGLTERDVAVSLENVEAENRKIIEPEANRYFFVADPTPLEIRGVPKGGMEGHAPLHPDHPERGKRTVKFPEGVAKVFLAKVDHDALRKDEIVRLKDLGNVRYQGQGVAEYAGNDLAVLKAGARIVQWVSAAPRATIPVRVLMPDEAGTVLQGVAEQDCIRDWGKVVQFERLGFVRLEREEKGTLIAPFAHT